MNHFMQHNSFVFINVGKKTDNKLNLYYSYITIHNTS